MALLTNVNTSNGSVFAFGACFDDLPRTFPFTGIAAKPLPFVMIFSFVGGGEDKLLPLCDFLLLFIALNCFVSVVCVA